MKDATHHLKHIQRKIIQAARKEDRIKRGPVLSTNESPENEKIVPEEFVSEDNRRVNRLPGYTNIH